MAPRAAIRNRWCPRPRSPLLPHRLQAKPVPPPPPPPAPTPAQPAAPTEDEIFRNKTLAQLNDEKPLGDVLFGLDSTDLSDAARTILQKDVDWMKKWPTTKVMVEGHADSRGTNRSCGYWSKADGSAAPPAVGLPRNAVAG